MRIIGLIFILSIVVSACKKPEDRSCWKFTGEEVSKTIEVDPFEQLQVQEHIECVLVQDSVFKVVLTGGENLLNLVDVQVENNKMTIHNRNKCNFLRSYKKKKIVAEIHFKNLFNIDFRGSDPLTNKDTLVTNWFTLAIKDGAGPVSLTIKADNVFAGVSHGWGDFTLNGSTNSAHFDVASNGYCDVTNLKIKDSLTFISRTSATCKINTQGVPLRAETKSYGDIWYYGIPMSTDFEKLGEGDLIDKN